MIKTLYNDQKMNKQRLAKIFSLKNLLRYSPGAVTDLASLDWASRLPHKRQTMTCRNSVPTISQYSKYRAEQNILHFSQVITIH